MKPRRPEKLNDVLERAKRCIEMGKYIATFHAECRQLERDITLPDALHVIKTGYRDKKHDKFKEEFNSWNYAINGQTLQNETVRAIISFDDKTRMLIITVINISNS